MNLSDQRTFMELFFTSCLAVTGNRARDYAPEGIPLLHTLAGAVDTGIDILPALWQLYNKQATAISRYIRHGTLDSDSANSRFMDAVNLLAFMAFFNNHPQQFYRVWAAYWVEQPCECEYDDPQSSPCRKHQTLLWLETRLSPNGCDRTLWRSTQKALVSFRTDRSNIGGTNQRGRSRSRSATSMVTRRTSTGESIRKHGGSSQARNTNRTPSDSFSTRQSTQK